MATSSEHYENLLSDVYSWMFGGFEAGIAQNRAFFAAHGVTPARSGRALDLGAGCGLQSIPLAERGFDVTAIDLDAKLLHELSRNRGSLAITAVQANLLDFDRHVPGPMELIVCMTDTLAHLESTEQVAIFCRKAADALDEGGKLFLTFRPSSAPLTGTDRFIPIRSDDRTILTCFLEYEPTTVKVHDLLYRKEGDRWHLSKSFYRKLRFGNDWIESRLSEAGLTVQSTVDKGWATVIATK